MLNRLFLRAFQIDQAKASFTRSYYSDIPALKGMERFEFNHPVTFFVGENGSGKSTLLEALAVTLGFNPEGGSLNFNFSTRETHSELYQFMRLVRGVERPQDGFFMRAESFYNLASNIDELARERGGAVFLNNYGGKSLHAQSHGESFLSLMLNRFRGNGLYILDEPEAALSPQRQLTMLVRIRELVQANAQLIIATHSPLLMAYPEADIFVLSEKGAVKTAFEETEHYTIMRHFLENPDKMLRYLFDSDN